MNVAKISKHFFTIRTHDLDSSGRASPAGLFRILENLRWHALRPCGLVEKYVKHGVIRAQSIEILRQVDFGDELEITMWVSRMGLTSFDLGYRLRLRADGIVARCAGTFVSLDSQGRPSPLDENFRELLSDEDTIEIPRLKHSPRRNAWSYPFAVRESELDLLQHVNQACFVDYLEDTRYACAKAGGYGEDSDRAAARLKSMAINYERQARAGDHLRVSTWAIDDIPRQYAFEIRRETDNTLMTRARLEVEA